MTTGGAHVYKQSTCRALEPIYDLRLYHLHLNGRQAVEHGLWVIYHPPADRSETLWDMGQTGRVRYVKPWFCFGCLPFGQASSQDAH